MLEKQTLTVLRKALEKMEEGFRHLPDMTEGARLEDMEKVLLRAAERMQDNYPYFHPLYAGQMLKPPHAVARLAYMLALWINPNNHALDGGRASSAMEKEVVADLAEIVGWKTHLGHLCGGGTMANLEALWVAGQMHRGKTIVASELAHYTHERISAVLGLSFEKVKCTKDGIMDVNRLEEIVRQGKIGTVVATIGTTGIGTVDPLPELLELQKKYGFRIHADAAYGGYFTLVENLDDPTRRKYDRLNEVDSVVIDPHKHGLQPYGCGCVIFKDPSVGKLYSHSSPYTYFTSSELHLGEISLECSRSGASAVALWATHQLLPPKRGGEFAAGLSKSREAAIKLHDKIAWDPRFLSLVTPELDIVSWGVMGKSISEISKLSSTVFERAAKKNLHLAKLNYPVELLQEHWSGIEIDQPLVTCLRSCLMKPQHLDWLERIWGIISDATDEAIGS